MVYALVLDYAVLPVSFYQASESKHNQVQRVSEVACDALGV